MVRDIINNFMETKTGLLREYFQGQVYYDDGDPVKPDDFFEVDDGYFTTDGETVCDLFHIELKDEEGSMSTCLLLDQVIKLRDELDSFIKNYPQDDD